MNKIKVLVCSSNDTPQVKEITPNTFNYKSLVDGWIEVIALEGKYLLYCNTAPKNAYRMFRGLALSGTFVITKLTNGVEVSLSDKEVAELTAELITPQIDVN